MSFGSLPPCDEHQVHTYHRVRAEYAKGARAIVAVVPTGGGKTRIGTEVVKGGISRGRRVLWLAHREELVTQAAASLAKIGVPHGVIKAGRPSSPNAPIQVASVQTLTARPDEMPPADIIVVDETHHVVASTWRALLDAYTKRELVLGLTATPERGDRKPLGLSSGGIYQALVVGATVAQLQKTLRNGHPILTPMHAVGPARYQRELWKSPIDGLRDHARRADGTMRPTIYFAGSVPEAEQVARACNAHGIRAASIDGKLGEDERAMRIARFSRGDLDVLTNVFVLTEGFDVPRTEVCAIGRGCSAASTFLQMLGRALRASPATGKKDALLIDYCGLSDVHGFVDDERDFSLDGRAIALREKNPIQQCKACGAVFRPAPRCPLCLVAAPKMTRPAREVKRSETVQITRDTVTPWSERKAFFDSLCATQRSRAYAPKWVGVQYRHRFGMWPPFRIPGAAA